MTRSPIELFWTAKKYNIRNNLTEQKKQFPVNFGLHLDESSQFSADTTITIPEN